MPVREGTIHTLMLREHKRITQFIEDFEKHLEDYEKTKKNFNILKWNLEKHFFVEEKAIFNMFVDISGEETDHIFNLLQDHVKIIGMLKVIEKGLIMKIKPDFRELKEKLLIHKDFEDQYFYPELDRKVNPNSKKEMISRVKEIIRG